MNSLENFIGREKEIEEFFNNYKELEENPENGKIYNLSYYGMGGIGKSWLLKKLKQEFEIRYKKSEYIAVDIREKSDCLTVLKNMAETLEQKYRYKFPCFGTAYNLYMEKTGEKARIALKKSKSKVRRFFEEIGREFVKAIPAGGLAVLGAEAYSDPEHAKNAETKKMKSMDTEELFLKLPDYFVIDMLVSRKNKNTPLVVFLDVYENLVNEVAMIGNPLVSDKWLYGEKGILKEIPGVLWVIGGRESLKWDKYNDYWESRINRVELQKFSPEESDEYLRLSGFENPELRGDIYRLTDGNPFYLCICKARLKEITAMGETPEISMFGKNTSDIFSRLIRDMDVSAQHICYMLCAIRRWNEEFMEDFLSKFSVLAYEKLKNLSFIEEKEDGFYEVNRTFAEVVTKECPESIRNEAGKMLIDTYQDSIGEKNFDSADYLNSVGSVLRAYTLLGKTRDEVCDLYRKNVKNLLVEYFEEKFHVIDFSFFDSFFAFAMERNDDLLYAEAIFMYCQYLYYKGRYVEAEKRMTPAILLFESLSEEDDEAAVLPQTLMMCILEFNGNIPKALELAERFYKRKEEKYGEESPLLAGEACNYANVLEKAGESKKALYYYEKAYRLSQVDKGDGWIYHNNYAHTLHGLGKYREALPIRKKIYDFWLAKDENHPYAVYARAGYADTLTKTGKAAEAIEIYETALAKVEEKELFDKDHPLLLDIECSYAVALAKLGNLSEAIKKVDEVIDKRKALFGENHRATLLAKHHKASMLYDAGNYSEAYEIQNELLSNHGEFFEQSRIEHLRAKSMMAVIKSNMDIPGMKDMAIAEQEAILEEFVTDYGYETYETLEAMNSMGIVYANCGNFKKAHEKLKEALPKYEAAYGTRHSITRNVARGVISTLHNGVNCRQMVYNSFLKGQEVRIKNKYGV